MSRVETYKNEAEWLGARRRGVGSSDIARLVFTGPHRVWHEKVFGYAEQFNGVDSLMQMGHDLEPVNAKIFTRETGIELNDPGAYAVAWDDDLPMCASVDRIAVDADGKHIALVELKATFGELARLCERMTVNDLRHSKLERYYWQVQHQLAVTGLESGYLSILFFAGVTAGHRWFKCERDERVIAAIRKRVQEFWTCVESDSPPDWQVATPSDIAAMTARPTSGNVIDLHGKQDVDAFVEFEQISQRRSVINAEFNEAKARWIARGDSAARLVCGDRQIQLRNDKGKPFFKLKDFKNDDD